MAGFADLEIGLHRRDADGYAVELRFSAPDSDTDVRLLGDADEVVHFDLDKARALALDESGYGAFLGHSLFASEHLQGALAQARANADGQDAALRVRLFIEPNAPELHRLRWETLRVPGSQSPLLTSERLLFSRYLSSDDWRPVRLRPQGDLRALVAIANPSNLAQYGLAPLDLGAELARVQGALEHLQVTALAKPGAASLTGISAALRDGHDVLYLLAHGALINGESRLWLEADDGTAAVVAGADLVARIGELNDRPRLVVLASCQSAGGAGDAPQGEIDALAALGPRMAEAGVPAVVAMQGSISTQTLDAFITSFFTELLRDGQIDRAMAAARGTVRDRPDNSMPVLFMRLRSGRLWYVPGFSTDDGGFEQWPAVLRSVRSGRCTPIVGPGVLESLFGSTRDIARGWAETYGFPMAAQSRDDLPQVAQYLAINQDPQFPRDELLGSLRQQVIARHGADLGDALDKVPLEDLTERVVEKRQTNDVSEPHRVLAGFACPLYLTTNPDSLLEAALRRAGKAPQVELCPWNDFVEQTNGADSATPAPQAPLVYKLFGQLSDPDSLVLTEDDYFDYLIGVTSNRDLIPEAVRRALADSALLFVGFQVDDWAFRVLFRSIMRQEGSDRRRRYAHVAVQIDPEEGRFQQPQRARRYLEQYFQTDDIRIYWGSAEDFLRELATRAAADSQAPPVGAVAAAAPTVVGQ